MRIAVNTRLLQKNKLEGIGRFSYEVLRRMVFDHPEVDFVFCFDRRFDKDFVFAPNVKAVVLKPQARHPFLFYIWFQYCLPRFLKKEKVDLLLSPDGFLPLNLPIKTVSVIHDIAFEHFENGVSWLQQQYYKYFFPKFSEQADRIITVSEFSKRDLVKTYGLPSEKVDVVYNGVSSAFKQLPKEEGHPHPYFICVGAIHPRKNILNLLKAFELFKSGNPGFKHRLLLVGRKSWQTKNINKYLKQMRFKSDVILKTDVNDEELNLLLNQATALIYPSFFEGFGLPVIEAFSCGIPVITSKGTAMEEISKGASYLFDPNSVTELSERMFEQASGNVENQGKIILGLNCIKQYNWDISAQLIWQSILKTLS